MFSSLLSMTSILFFIFYFLLSHYPALASPVDGSVAPQKEFTFYTGTGSPQKEISEGRLHEAFQRIGFKFKLVHVGSSQRALILANTEGDGDPNRVPNIKEIAPDETTNLIQIPEAVTTIVFHVYSKGAVSAVNGYESLRGLRNGFRIGTKILEKNIPQKRIILPNSDRLFQMLDAGRLDTVVSLDFVAQKIIKKNNYAGITRLSPPLVIVPAYSLIHKKHQALVPKLVKALQEMKTDGTFDKIKADILKGETL